MNRLVHRDISFLAVAKKKTEKVISEVFTFYMFHKNRKKTKTFSFVREVSKIKND